MIRYRLHGLLISCIAVATFSSVTLDAQQNAAPVKMVEVDEDPLENQRLVQLRRHLKAQLSFVKSALELSDEQLEKLAGFNDEWLRTIARDAAKPKIGSANLGNVLARAMGGGAAVPVQLADNQDPILKKAIVSVNTKVDELLSSQQRDQVKLERQARSDFQEQAFAEFTVSLIERQIHLSDEQAQQLVPALTVKININSGWRVYLNNPQYIPVIPDAALSRVLNSDQVRIIRSLSQQDFSGNNFGFEQLLGIQADAEE